MDYEKLSKDDFDAVVTGEMTHYALWNEKWLDGLIAVYFISDLTKQSDFRRLILDRDGRGGRGRDGGRGGGEGVKMSLSINYGRVGVSASAALR